MDELERLGSQIGLTPLYELDTKHIPNGNRIFAKEEWKNPTGSHYDRTYLSFFRALEKSGKIKRGETRLIESTAGTAGRSFGWFCKHLGYKGIVVTPEDLPPKRIEAIVKQGVELVKSPAGEYTRGASNKVRELLLKDAELFPKEKRLYCLNHSKDWLAVDAMGEIALEALQQLPQEVDYFLAACGNGSTLIGIGRELKRANSNIKVISCDPAEVPMSFSIMYPEVCAPASLQAVKHDVYGTGHWGIHTPFLEEPYFSEIVDDVVVVNEEKRKEALNILHNVEGKYVGHSSALTLAAALKICEDVKGKNFLIPFYDSYSLYEAI